MAIYNISYKSKETDKLINEELGKAYSLFNKLKLGGIGSRRMIIEHLSERINHLKLSVSGLQYGNIEIRPSGIILHINLGIYTYAWTIPYYHLNIYNGDFFTIHGGGNYIQFNKEKSWKENRKFLTKLIHLKAKFNSVK